METTNVTFSGQEPEKINLGEIETIIKMLDGGRPEITWISYNLYEEQLDRLFPKAPEVETSTLMYAGLPMYKAPYVPLGEVWMQDKDGHVVRKFRLPSIG